MNNKLNSEIAGVCPGSIWKLFSSKMPFHKHYTPFLINIYNVCLPLVLSNKNCIFLLSKHINGNLWFHYLLQHLLPLVGTFPLQQSLFWTLPPQFQGHPKERYPTEKQYRNITEKQENPFQARQPADKYLQRQRQKIIFCLTLQPRKDQSLRSI